MPAVLPTMMFGTEEIRVSNPPTLVSNPSISKKPSNFSERSNFLRETPVREPTIIMAVTLFSTAEKTTVITP